MKLSVVLLSLFLISCGVPFQSDENIEQRLKEEGRLDTPNDEETDDFVLSFEQAQNDHKKLNLQIYSSGFRFSQTQWNECHEDITGNYSGYSCVKSRGISKILKRFVDDYIQECINQGLQAQGGGYLDELHIEHAGILGDRNHSPRSLHAENRAIDIIAFEIKLTDGWVKRYDFADMIHRPFYRAFRRCWGETVQNYNGCPVYNGNLEHTGSIGWENSRHKNHMHLSVPYCLRGQYGSYYYRR